MTDLGTPGGLWGFAYGINDAGDVVGNFQPAGHAARWKRSGDEWEMTDLGVATAWAINGAGQIAGTRGAWRATIWTLGSDIISPQPTPVSFTALSGTSGADVWAGGGRTVAGLCDVQSPTDPATMLTLLHYDGSAWRHDLNQCRAATRAIWAGNTTVVQAASSWQLYGLIWRSGPSSSWDQELGTMLGNKPMGEGPALLGVWMSPDENVQFAVGHQGMIRRHNPGGNPLWQEEVPRPTGRSLWSVWGANSGDVYAVGDSVIVHYDGIGWNTVTTIVDTNGDPIQYLDENGDPIDLGEKIGFFLFEVFGTGENDIFAVGLHGAILHYDGTVWRKLDSPTAENLGGVWANNEYVFVVGQNGVLFGGTR